MHSGGTLSRPATVQELISVSYFGPLDSNRSVSFSCTDELDMRVFYGSIDSASVRRDFGRNFDNHFDNGMKRLAHTIADMTKILSGVTPPCFQDDEMSLGTHFGLGSNVCWPAIDAVENLHKVSPASLACNE